MTFNDIYRCRLGISMDRVAGCFADYPNEWVWWDGEKGWVDL